MNARARTAAVAAIALMMVAGCKTAAPNDATLQQQVQAKLAAETALAGQPIQVTVSNGVATLNGNAADEASRALAANDVAQVAGLKTVVNNLTVQPQQSAMAAPMEERPAEERPAETKERAEKPKAARKQKPVEMAQNTPPPPPPPAPAPAPEAVQAVPPPPPPPQPITKAITIPAGTTVPIRISEALDSDTTKPNTPFHGSLATDVMVGGVVAIPRGSTVNGTVVDAKDAGHFKGNSLLSLQLMHVQARGQSLALVTDPITQEGKGRGKNTAEKIGGGAALGAIIGALAGGGKGAAIGAAAGGGLGAGANAVTRGEQVKIPSETLLPFKLSQPVTVNVTIQPGQPGYPGVAGPAAVYNNNGFQQRN